ncbi:DUF2182 domain-containing protein [Halomonas sp. HP20-15]|uniref:DUF2182 domain-containing protein n=1 Tax=Halomonas sp. HP20-15 TaxID=3085901 RepID=UPI002980D36A|nr:DUF2182 domain-containing protein [Halomonas sp. HP20-15]MDW5375382.1 DUF2182 domain-containing protein [Halomonas sp. HP20-15]
MATSLLERALRHDRTLVASVLLVVVVLCWAYLVVGAGVMTGMAGEMAMAPVAWTPAHALTLLAMWAIMMVAMMLPGAAPLLLLFVAIGRARHSSAWRMAASGMFSLGYIAIWTAFSLAAVVLQFALERAALLSPMMQTTSTALAGAVLIAAGIYQWTPLKHACLRHCRSPLDFVLTHWREGLRGAFAMGFRHGIYCLGCCWVLMLLLFVGGVMNLLWIAGLALLVLMEKLAPAGHWLGWTTGAALVVWGSVVLMTVY